MLFLADLENVSHSGNTKSQRRLQRPNKSAFSTRSNFQPQAQDFMFSSYPQLSARACIDKP
jgi:hypothetical protein